MSLKSRLDAEVRKRNDPDELSFEKPDPLLVARRYRDERVALICALFAYGNAKQIVKFLDSLDFSLLERSESELRSALDGHYYRFQNSEDVIQLFLTLQKAGSLEEIFMEGYRHNHSVLEGLALLIQSLYDLNPYRSRGYTFLLGSAPTQRSKSTYKRWNMYLRWMVRKDALDLGLWSGVRRSDLLMPLDTHTFEVSKKLGLLKRKSYDLKAVLELTQRLRLFDPEDPIKYDFAIYRLGQEGRV